MSAHSGVEINPGDTVFTRSDDSSNIRPRASDSSAALIAPCNTKILLGPVLRKPDTNVSEPPIHSMSTAPLPAFFPHSQNLAPRVRVFVDDLQIRLQQA